MNNNPQDPTFDKRDAEKEGGSLSGSKLRDNVSTEKALHPEPQSETDLVETVDQDPGERQKENQNSSKDDPLAA